MGIGKLFLIAEYGIEYVIYGFFIKILGGHQNGLGSKCVYIGCLAGIGARLNGDFGKGRPAINQFIYIIVVHVSHARITEPDQLL